MKRVISIVLSLVLVMGSFLFSGCANQTEDTIISEETESVTEIENEEITTDNVDETIEETTEASEVTTYTNMEDYVGSYTDGYDWFSIYSAYGSTYYIEKYFQFSVILKFRNYIRRKRGKPEIVIPEKPLPQGLVVGCGKDNQAIVDTGDVHALMLGAAGVGKTAYWLYPCIEYALASGMSFLSTDTKGDIMRNYGKEGAEIIIDNTQLTISGGFAPNSTSADAISKALGTRTVMSGSISKSKEQPSQSLQMIERPLMTADELRNLPKGMFIVMKTGFHPMKVRMKLFFKWGILFDEKNPYEVKENGNRKVAYVGKEAIKEARRALSTRS